jgi:DNA-3-methyladenine glycosylase I
LIRKSPEWGGFPAILARSIILPKRDAFQKACRNFDPEKVVRFSEADISGIVRSSAKIEATIGGSRLSKKN